MFVQPMIIFMSLYILFRIVMVILKKHDKALCNTIMISMFLTTFLANIYMDKVVIGNQEDLKAFNISSYNEQDESIKSFSLDYFECTEVNPAFSLSSNDGKY